MSSRSSTGALIGDTVNSNKFCLHANEGCTSKTKYSLCNIHLDFESLCSGKKSVCYTQENMVMS